MASYYPIDLYCHRRKNIRCQRQPARVLWRAMDIGCLRSVQINALFRLSLATVKCIRVEFPVHASIPNVTVAMLWILSLLRTLHIPTWGNKLRWRWPGRKQTSQEISPYCHRTRTKSNTRLIFQRHHKKNIPRAPQNHFL